MLIFPLAGLAGSAVRVVQLIISIVGVFFYRPFLKNAERVALKTMG